MDSIDFYIINLDRYSGKLIMHEDKLFAGRMEFEIEDFEVTIDKRYDFTKELDEIARSKRFASILSPYFSTLGSLKSKEAYYSQEKANCTFVYFPCHFENGDLNVVITINENQEIANVSFNDYQEDVE